MRAASDWIRETAKRETAEGRRVMRKVVNITSIAGTDGGAGQAGYSSGKAGVVGLTKTLAKEWGRYNVNVNAVGFGLIETRLIQPMAEGADTSIDMHGRKLGYDDIWCDVEPDGERARVTLLVRGLTAESAEALLGAALVLLDNAVGEHDAMAKISELNNCPLPRQPVRAPGFFPLSELPAYLDGREAERGTRLGPP